MQTMIRAGMAAVMLAVGLPLAAQSEEPAGILVTAVDPDGPAATAGIERGDLILSVDGQAVTTTGELTEALAAAEGRRGHAGHQARGRGGAIRWCSSIRSGDGPASG